MGSEIIKSVFFDSTQTEGQNGDAQTDVVSKIVDI